MYIWCMWTYLGQNFLVDVKVRHYIADHILALYQDLWCEALIEVGPGKWAITKLICQISKNFFVIEKDATLKFHLNEILANGGVVWWDVLEVDVEKLLKDKKINTKKTLVVGNLPYYISSPILRKFFGEGHQDFAWGIFMVQDEVAQRLASDVRRKSYLWRLLNYAYHVKYLKWVPAKCFKPAPKVKSALIQLTANNLQLRVKLDAVIRFLDLYSAFTRKTLGAISTMLSKKWTNIFVIPEKLRKKRLEELSWKDMEEIVVSG